MGRVISKIILFLHLERMEMRFKTGILRDCTAVYSYDLPTEPEGVWKSVAVFNSSKSNCRAEINVQMFRNSARRL